MSFLCHVGSKRDDTQAVLPIHMKDTVMKKVTQGLREPDIRDRRGTLGLVTSVEHLKDQEQSLVTCCHMIYLKRKTVYDDSNFI